MSDAETGMEFDCARSEREIRAYYTGLFDGWNSLDSMLDWLLKAPPQALRPKHRDGAIVAVQALKMEIARRATQTMLEMDAVIAAEARGTGTVQ